MIKFPKPESNSGRQTPCCEHTILPTALQKSIMQMKKAGKYKWQNLDYAGEDYVAFNLFILRSPPFLIKHFQHSRQNTFTTNTEKGSKLTRLESNQ